MNSWQQPVSGEPSLGTFHWHFNTVYNADPATTAWQTLTMTTDLPSGTKAVYVVASLQDTAGAAGRNLSISNTSTGGAILTAYNIGSSPGNVSGIVPVTTGLSIAWYVSNADIDNVTIRLLGYWC